MVWAELSSYPAIEVTSTLVPGVCERDKKFYDASETKMSECCLYSAQTAISELVSCLLRLDISASREVAEKEQSENECSSHLHAYPLSISQPRSIAIPVSIQNEGRSTL